VNVETAIPRHATHNSIPIRDKDGRWFLVPVVKYTFAVDPSGKVDPAEDPPPIDLVDTYHGKDPAKSSIRRPSQVFDQKPGTDVILLGHAHPRLHETSATHVDVSLRVGAVAKTVRAHGLRVWQMGTFGGLKPGPARPVREPIPLVYELAWGGMDLSEEKKPIGEPHNYVGRGIARDPKTLVDRPAAQLEDPAHPLDGRNNQAAAFNPIHRHWQPRIQFAGTYDQTWMDTRMPILPANFDPRHHICVPPDQWSGVPLRSDQPFEVLGATPDGVWRFQLPRIVLGYSSFMGGQRVEHRTYLDTVLIDADARRVELTWRAAIPLPRKYEMLERVRIFEKEVI
jgi:hypothetical protein